MTEFTEENVKKGFIPLLDKIGFVIEGTAKELCPVDTGRLRASIQHRVIPEELSVVIGTDVWYGPYVEYMYPLEAPRPGRETGQMPFLRPAIFLAKPEINRMIKEHFGGK